MNPEGRPRPLPVQVLGSAVLLQEEAVLQVLTALGVYERSLKANGAQPSPRLLGLQRAFALAALAVHAQNGDVSQVRQRDATLDASQPDSTQTAQIGTREAAQMLGVTTRQVQRLAATLDGRRLANGHIIFDRLAVQSYALAIRNNHRTAA